MQFPPTFADPMVPHAFPRNDGSHHQAGESEQAPFRILMLK